MKYFVVFFMLIMLSCRKSDQGQARAKHIPSIADSLVTIEDVTAYLRLADTNFNCFRLKPMINFRFAESGRKEYERIIGRFADDLDIDKSFYKADFDNNGYTDVLVMGDFYHDEANPQAFGSFSLFALFNFGTNSPKIYELSDRFFVDAVVPKIERRDSEPLLHLYSVKQSVEAIQQKKTDTVHIVLTGKFGLFTEYNKGPKDYKIEKIQYDAEPCHGKCPTFEITVNSDRSAWFIAQSFNFSKERTPMSETEGTFTTKLNQADYDRFMAIINYLDFPNLKDDYFVPQFHMPGAKLIITYDGGKTKTIHDYGQNGTHGLRGLYNLLSEMRFNQNWKKAKEPEGLRISQW